MNSIDASTHVEISRTEQAPSLLILIIDTNPRAWAALSKTLPFSQAIANVLVFVNAHLAFDSNNQVAILAAHSNRAVWLYPKSPNPDHHPGGGSGDIEMTDRDPVGAISANKYPQFVEIENSLLTELKSLISSTSPSNLPETTLVAGALTCALAFIHKTLLSLLPPAKSGSEAAIQTATATPETPTLHSRILVLGVSDSSPSQYIATMNAVFAASHNRIPIDTLSLSPFASPTFLQQAAFITGGVYLDASSNPQGLLAYLMSGLIPDADQRTMVLCPTQEKVDFRSACFCHRKVVDTGFVCSICLSIFCEVPKAEDGGAECLTCGSRLALGKYGAKPAVIVRKKKKKKAVRLNGVGREDTGSAAGTPAPYQ